MCTSLNTIIEIINARVNNDEMFTAFDISLAVQDKAKQAGLPVERHRDMKQDIHKEMQKFIDCGSYEKTLRDVGAKTQAFVYHATGTDCSNYQPIQKNQPVLKTDLSTDHALTPSFMPLNGSNNGWRPGYSDRHTDDRGCLTIPADMIKKAGFTFPDVAYIWTDTGQDMNGQTTKRLCVSKNPPNSSITPLKSYGVNKWFNIRIKMLSVGFSDMVGYDFAIENGDKIVIAEH